MLLLEPQFTPLMLPLVRSEPSEVKILISLKVKMAEFKFRTMEMLSMLSLLMSKQAMVSFMSSMLSFCNFKYKNTNSYILSSLWRTKREASEGLVEVDEDDFYEFLQQVNDHKHYKQNAMGNLTCVLQKCGQLTEDMEINMDFYAAALRAEEPENGFTWDAEGSAAKDPEWREKIATAYEDCHELAESWPATSLNRRPMT